MMDCKFCERDASDGLRWARHTKVTDSLFLDGAEPETIFYACTQCLRQRIDQQFISAKPDRHLWGWLNVRDVKPLPKPRNPKKTPKAKPTTGFVYLVQAGGRFKIGITSNVQSRIKGIQTGNPDKVTLVCSVEHPEPRKLEAELHRIFSPYRLEGEWFQLSIGQVGQCKQIMAQQGAAA